jgi:hypothetical protein
MSSTPGYSGDTKTGGEGCNLPAPPAKGVNAMSIVFFACSDVQGVFVRHAPIFQNLFAHPLAVSVTDRYRYRNRVR